MIVLEILCFILVSIILVMLGLLAVGNLSTKRNKNDIYLRPVNGKRY